MRILVVTNLYPPQELGGYGRAIADFVWGLQQRGHQLQVVCSNARYLGPSGQGPSGEPVDRRLQLKGSFEGGVKHLQDAAVRRAVDQANAGLLRHCLQSAVWDGVLLGNLDLLGHELLSVLLEPGIPVLHHVGFVTPPYAPEQFPNEPHYQLVAASRAVRTSMVAAGLPVMSAPVVYPGARVDLFGPQATGRPLPPLPDGSPGRPLRVCFAGLMMSSKGPHTLLEALAVLRQRGLSVHANFAGAHFQADYVAEMQRFIQDIGLSGQVHFIGFLKRVQLARFFALHHVCVFPSNYPEAFGIVGAEAMASGLALVSSGAGGAAELFESGVSGMSFGVGDALDLATQLQILAEYPFLLADLQRKAYLRVREQFSVHRASQQLEGLLMRRA